MQPYIFILANVTNYGRRASRRTVNSLVGISFGFLSENSLAEFLRRDSEFFVSPKFFGSSRAEARSWLGQ